MTNNIHCLAWDTTPLIVLENLVTDLTNIDLHDLEQALKANALSERDAKELRGVAHTAVQKMCLGNLGAQHVQK